MCLYMCMFLVILKDVVDLWTYSDSFLVSFITFTGTLFRHSYYCDWSIIKLDPSDESSAEFLPSDSEDFKKLSLYLN